MSRLRTDGDFCSVHGYHLILIGEPICFAFVLQRKAIFSVWLAFLVAASLSCWYNELPCSLSLCSLNYPEQPSAGAAGIPTTAPVASLEAATREGQWSIEKMIRATAVPPRAILEPSPLSCPVPPQTSSRDAVNSG